jgi:hypothetical protein
VRAAIDKIRGKVEKVNVATVTAATASAPVAPRSPEPVATAGSAPERQRQVVLKPDGTRVTLQDMLGAGVLPRDAALESSVRGVSHLARLRDSQVEMGGQIYENLSEAAKAASGSNRNGWYVWKYQGEFLREIRRRFADQLAAEANRSVM